MVVFRESQKQALRRFEYAGRDCSKVYEYVLSPLAAYLVTWLPTWLAPNTITAIGLLAAVVAYAAGHYYSPALSSCDEVPRWVFLLSAWSLLFYQTLDNMDGKQARRTGSSSALGLLFDHGCDALNTFFSGFHFAVTICSGTGPRLLLLIMAIPALPFYTGTWEEYHTGALILPVINGPTEGILIAAGCNVVSYMYGPDWWRSPLPDELVKSSWYQLGPNRIDLFEAFGYTTITLTAIKQVVAVLWTRYRCTGSVSVLWSALLDLVPLGWIGGWAAKYMLSDAGRNLLVAHPRAMAALLSTLFVEAVVGLMLAHVTKARFNPYRLIAAPLPLFYVGQKIGVSDDMQAYFLLGYLATAILYLGWYLTTAVMECRYALDVDCFSIRRQVERNQQNASKRKSPGTTPRRRARHEAGRGEENGHQEAASEENEVLTPGRRSARQRRRPKEFIPGTPNVAGL
mmetsp:Transcript_56068/g.154463  ORF Transcript_56068/g.154463 Transcript_56068/m.154463 type:complete len:457 (-) Transcript_56068:336-1706(-)